MTALLVMTTADWIASVFGFCGIVLSIISLIISQNSKLNSEKAQTDANKALTASAEAQKDLAKTQLEVKEMMKKNYQREEENRKKAYLVAKISGRSLTLTNQGEATAKNITFTIDLEDNGYTIEGNSPFKISELRSGDQKKWTVHLNGQKKEIPATYSWDDDYGTGRTEETTIHVN